MANATDPLAKAVHGTDPQNLIEAILRNRIYECRYWKEHCFGLTADSIIEKAIKLEYVGSTYSAASRPTPFICLVLKLLQIQPDKEIIHEYLKASDYKYLQALGAFYLRLVGRPAEIYQHLEPLLDDFRKIAKRNVSGWSIIHMDEFIDELLTEEFCCEIALPLLQKRDVLVEAGYLTPRKSLLDDEITDAMQNEAEEDTTMARELLMQATSSAGDDSAVPTNTRTKQMSHPDFKTSGDASRSSGRDEVRNGARDHRRRSRSRSRHSRSASRDRHDRDRDHHGYGSRHHDRYDSGRRRYSRSRSRSRSAERRRRYEDEEDRGRRESSRERRRSDSRDRRRRSSSRDRRRRSSSRDRRRRHDSPDEHSRGDSRERRREDVDVAAAEINRKAPLSQRQVSHVASKLFKKGAVAAPQPATTSSLSAAASNAPEDSIEYQNELRAKLGLKPLRP